MRRLDSERSLDYSCISLIIYHNHYPIQSKIMQYHPISCYIIQHHAIVSNIMQFHLTSCDIFQYHSTLQRHPTSSNIIENHLHLINQSKILKVHLKIQCEDIWLGRFLLYLAIEVENTFIRSRICLEIISNCVRVTQTLRKF